MDRYETVNILDMLEAIGEDALVAILSDFSCPKNPEIETFVRKNALDFAKKKISITYMVMDSTNGDLVSIFALTHKALEINCTGLSSTTQKKLSRYAQYDKKSKICSVSAFLIAQFGKNYVKECPDGWSGDRLMEKTFEVLVSIQKAIGGGIVYLECEEKEELLSFYQNENNRFHPFNERYSDDDQTKYIQLLRLF